MSIWGKVIGGWAGFAIGGPLGAILGVAAGHAIDKSKNKRNADGFSENLDAQQIAFTSAVIVLCAKMAKADGHVTPDEISVFKRIFHIPAEEQENVGKLFNEARREVAGFERYATQIASLFSQKPSVLEEILGALFSIAKADGVIHEKELEFLKSVASIFGFSESKFLRLKATYINVDREGESQEKPYEVLGISRESSDADIKKQYRKLIQNYHPDKLMAHGVPQEFIDLANEKMATINSAYDKIERERGLK